MIVGGEDHDLFYCRAYCTPINLQYSVLILVVVLINDAVFNSEILPGLRKIDGDKRLESTGYLVQWRRGEKGIR